MKKLLYILMLLVSIVSCTDDFGLRADGEINEGDEVMFTTNVPKPIVVTRGLNTEILKSYQTINRQYELKVTMLKGNNQLVGTGTYKPVTDVPIEKEEDDVASNYDDEGTLEAVGNGLSWETSTQRYAFEATAGSDAIESNQSTRALWLKQDRLHGFAFSPYEPDDGTSADKIGEPNYHTSKEWYQLNKAWHNAEGLMQDENKASTEYKKIPLFLQHQRSWITIVVKAGKGVKREAVEALYDESTKTYNPTITTSIYSYPTGSTQPTIVDRTLVGSASVQYDEDVNGGEEKRQNLRFDAIVEPHNYLEHPKDDKIAAINMSNMHFSFYASNDTKFSSATADDVAAMEEAYNLTAGKHLTIEATLATDRIVFITAWIEDWTEVVTSTICDDYGQQGDPTVIKSRDGLIAFLKDNDLNRAGNVGIIAATELDLDSITSAAGVEPVVVDKWTNYNGYTLKATLNLAGATLKSSDRLFNSISSTGNLTHGTVVMNNTESVASAIAATNAGTIDNIDIIVGNKQASANRAGFVETNNGYILNCTSTLPVRAGDEDVETYIGGIAAQSFATDGTIVPTIDHCTMFAAVKGGNNVKGGGIVGEAEGSLNNNTFDYGITLMQMPASFKNIVHSKRTDGILNASNNSWPTLADNKDALGNDIAGTNASNALFHNVLDCQEEMKKLISDTYNVVGYRYRIADDFTVLAEEWNYAQATEDITTRGNTCGGNLYCELDGNGKTITLDTNGSTKVSIPKEYDTDGKGTAFEELSTVHMLFSNITGYVHDMTIELKAPLIAVPGLSDEQKYNATDAIAALAYAVRQPESTSGLTGTYGVVRNVNVIMDEDCHVQAATAAGLVCWVHHDGVVDNCNVRGTVLSWTPNSSVNTDATRYIGGVVACAADATIMNSAYYPNTTKTEDVVLTVPTLDIAEYSGKMNTFYGGILGGTVAWGTGSSKEEPRVSLVDNASWYQSTFADTTDGNASRQQHGAILGYSYYAKDSSNKLGTIVEGDDGVCQGNWWQADMSGVAPGGVLNGYTVETTIGKRNAVTPQQKNF